jgi:hypothetical protein
MFAKLMGLTVMAVCLTAALLVLRHQRLQAAHDVADLYRQTREARLELWQAQTQAAYAVSPGQLRQRLAESQLAMEPAAPTLNDSGDSRFVRVDLSTTAFQP